MNVNEWHDYFEHMGQGWVHNAYSHEGYNYPVGYHRLRILEKILKSYDLEGKRVLDIGCGGGEISLYLASLGAVVDGVDMTETMLEIANERRHRLEKAVQEKIHFHLCEFHSVKNFLKRKYDFVIAFGLIGYLESDALFFETVRELSHTQSILILSCRNRLFNITSVTSNTVKEIHQGDAIRLIEEIDRCWKKEIPVQKQMDFVQSIKAAASKLKEWPDYVVSSESEEGKELPGTGERQPRQSTPDSLEADAKVYGFYKKRIFGVHPHLLLPRLNKKLPPAVFNILSDALCVLEDEPVSLVYSSVFVVEMVKE